MADSRIAKVEQLPQWRKDLSEMMATWHLSIHQIEQFMIKTIEEEIAKQK